MYKAWFVQLFISRLTILMPNFAPCFTFDNSGNYWWLMMITSDNRRATRYSNNTFSNHSSKNREYCMRSVYDINTSNKMVILASIFYEQILVWRVAQN